MTAHNTTKGYASHKDSINSIQNDKIIQMKLETGKSTLCFSFITYTSSYPYWTGSLCFTYAYRE
jgi:hypothetical protein